jgi:hypothetical protein
VVEQRADLGLREEHLAEARVVGILGTDELERDVALAAEAAYPGVEDLAHAADADAAHHFEPSEADDRPRRRHVRSVPR